MIVWRKNQLSGDWKILFIFVTSMSQNIRNLNQKEDVLSTSTRNRANLLVISMVRSMKMEIDKLLNLFIFFRMEAILLEILSRITMEFMWMKIQAISMKDNGVTINLMDSVMKNQQKEFMKVPSKKDLKMGKAN